MITNRYYIVENLTPEVEVEARSLNASAILVGIPENLRDLSISENWSLPHLWVETFTNPEIGPEDVTQFLS